MTQTITPRTWTKLNGYEVEAYQDTGGALNVDVVDGKVEPVLDVLLRPTAGTYSPGWKAPVTGRYCFDVTSPISNRAATFTVLLEPHMIVTDPGGLVEFVDGEKAVGPQIAMDGGWYTAPTIRDTSGNRIVINAEPA